LHSFFQFFITKLIKEFFMSTRNNWAIIATCLIGTTALFWMPNPLAEQNQAPIDWQQELRQIDSEIKQCEELRDRYLAEARRAEDQGMRWQFMQNQKQEAKRAFQRAEDKKQAAQMLQTRIDSLNARRTQILQEHGRTT
jgi:cell fate (sporulation/competence/biofilm development) regulator YmcA (YheA/YmcA/DUF963 family)